MVLDAAPLYEGAKPGPAGGGAFWIKTSDDLRLRIAAWRPADGIRGTVLLFPGRTEYVEKYGQIARELAAHDLATLAIDWRGQGLADRLLDDRLVGHVETFADYQRDVSAMVRAARSLDLPKPWFLIGHSMGGCIGLRAVMEGLPVAAACFTGPMWGIRISPALQPVAWALGWLLPKLGLGHINPPGTSSEPYVLANPFEDNMLTRDREMWDMMQQHLQAEPDLALGGPSVTWLNEALRETAALAARPAPDMPCITFLGTNERIVDVNRVQDRMQSWTGSTLEMVEDGEHEVLLEDAPIREAIIAKMTARFFKAAG